MTAPLPLSLSVFLAQAADGSPASAPASAPVQPPPAAPAAVTTATTGTAAPAAPAPGTQPPASTGLLGSPMVPLLLMGVIFYFMIIRPQQRRAREAAALVASIKSGDEVLTSAGIYGTVTNVNPEKKTVTVRIADGVKVVMSREAVTTVLNKSAAGNVAATATAR